MTKMTLKQQRFADEYIITGNLYKSAVEAGYSEKYAKAQSHKLLENVGIKNYIDERLKVIESQKTATQQEIMEYLTSVMRGEKKEEILIGKGMGFQEITKIDVSAKDRLKAADLLNKIHLVREDKKENSSQEDKISDLFKLVDGEINGLK